MTRHLRFSVRSVFIIAAITLSTLPDALLDGGSACASAASTGTLEDGILAICPQPPRPVYERGSVAIQVATTLPDSVFASLNLAEMSLNSHPHVSQNPPSLVGLNGDLVPGARELIFYWVPAPGESGAWEICFASVSETGDSVLHCATVTVAVPDPYHVYWEPRITTFDSTALAAVDWRIFLVTGLDSTILFELPFEFSYLAGAVPLVDTLSETDLFIPPEFDIYEWQSSYAFNPQSAGGADSLLIAIYEWDGYGLPAGQYYLDLSVKPLGTEGIGSIDTVTIDHGPINTFNFFHWTGILPELFEDIFPTYSPGCFPLIRHVNAPPVVRCPDTALGISALGELIELSGFSYDDPDDGPGPYTFQIESISRDGQPASPTHAPFIDGDTFRWQTSDSDTQDVGVWEFCISCSDGIQKSDNTCCFTVEIIAETPYCLSFVDPGYSAVDEQPGDNVVNVIAGQMAEICINLEKQAGPQCMGGFDLLLCFDPSLLSLHSVTPGDAIQDWEFFTYRLLSNAKVRLIGIKDMNNSQPSQAPCNGLGPIVCMKFKTTRDQTLACQKAPIRFCWLDCGDNSISSEDGNRLYVVGDEAGGIVDVSGEQIFDVTPDPFGFNATVLRDCDWDTIKCEACVEPIVCFHNGGIRLLCPGEIDLRGDLNLNAVANEIADAVLYTNYFISGSSVLGVNYQAQVAASDVNADGVPLTVADLVYLIRIITGDAVPVPDDYIGGSKVAAAVGTLHVTSALRDRHLSVSATSDQDLGAALFVLKYENTEIEDVAVTGRASNMDVDFAAASGELRVLVCNIQERARIAAGSGDVLIVSTLGAGYVGLVSVEAVTFTGDHLETSVDAKVVPTEFALRQNFPNPFNASTSLALDLPDASDYRLTIYNIAGQLVKTYAGHSEAGTLTITWDGTSGVGGKVASGVYFYALEAGTFKDVKRMLLLK